MGDQTCPGVVVERIMLVCQEEVIRRMREEERGCVQGKNDGDGKKR